MYSSLDVPCFSKLSRHSSLSLFATANPHISLKVEYISPLAKSLSNYLDVHIQPALYSATFEDEKKFTVSPPETVGNLLFGHSHGLSEHRTGCARVYVCACELKFVVRYQLSHVKTVTSVRSYCKNF